MTNGKEETATSTRGGSAGSGARRKIPKFTEDDKENFSIFGGDACLCEKNSPLPVGYPRLPLQDITAVLRPLKNNSDEEDPNTGLRKPFTRSQGSRKLGQVQTKVLSERISKNVNRGTSRRTGPTKLRKRQVVKIVMDESETVAVSGEPGQLKEETVQHTVAVSSSVKLTESTQEGQKIGDVVSSVDEATSKVTGKTNVSGSTVVAQIADKGDKGKAMDLYETTVTNTDGRTVAPGEQLASNAPSNSTLNQLNRDQKRRPLTGRSSVSSFR